MLYVLINAIVTAPLQGFFFFFLKSIGLCVWPARLGKAIVCNFCSNPCEIDPLRYFAEDLLHYRLVLLRLL